MSPTKPTGAMALLEKYSALNSGMEEARSENAATKSNIESTRQQIERLSVERQEMEAQTAQARDDTAGLHKDVQEAMSKLRELEDKQTLALLEKTEASRQLDFCQQYVEGQRQSFLDASRDFRTSCKRMRLSASAVGDDMATSKAFLEQHHHGEDYDSDNDDEASVHVAKDVDMEQAMERHCRLKEARDEAQRQYRHVQVREESSSEQSAIRLDRKSQLLAQLERVRKDNADLEEQLKSLDQQTREAREVAHNLEKDIERRTSGRGARSFTATSVSTSRTFQNPITPSPAYGAPSRSQQATGGRSAPRNPYASRRTSASSSQQQQSSSSQQDVVLGRQWNSFDDHREAHPHLTGRVRLDRQFGSALEISSGGVAEANAPMEASNEVPEYRPRSNPIILDDDDDDDDDELLSYVAFSKK